MILKLGRSFIGKVRNASVLFCVLVFMRFEHGALLLQFGHACPGAFLPVPEATRGLGERWLVWPGEEPPTLPGSMALTFTQGSRWGAENRGLG